MEYLTRLTAIEAADHIKNRRLLAVDLMQAVLDTAQQTQSAFNAFTVIDINGALEQAQQADRAVVEGHASLGPLHGVPVSIKDLINTAGLETSYGSAIHRGHVPSHDAIAVARLKAAGAIVFAKTTTPEFGHKGLTDSPEFGRTLNPWGPGFTPGGSSGGAAVAVACGAGPVALGTDGAGSVRIPAACCHLVGLKPTRGAVPVENASDLFQNYSFVGPITRTVADARIILQIISGPDDRDPWTLGRVEPNAGLSSQMQKPRVGLLLRMANAHLSETVRKATLDAASHLESLGCRVVELDSAIDWIEAEGRILMRTGMWCRFHSHMSLWRERMDPCLLKFMEEGRQITMEQLRAAEAARTGLYREVQQLFGQVDFLLTPALVRAPLKVDFDAACDEAIVDGQYAGFTRTGWTAFMYPFNLTGHPALAMPHGFDDDGLPIGIQLVGRWYSDDDLLSLGEEFERITDFTQHWPSLTP